jgi:predicted DNA-binding protein (MmcQ/YjbR family)
MALPGATETVTWGHPLFRVADKIFVGYGDDGGGESMSAKVGKGRQAKLIRDSRYSIAPYVGRFGWVQFKLSGKVDWDEVTGLVLESYRLIAPKPMLKKMDGEAGRAGDAAKSAKRKPAKSGSKRG